ncbi:MAG: DUF294 nucleotidyltransferase-like domain-containing protein [Bacillota bacterium]
MPFDAFTEDRLRESPLLRKRVSEIMTPLPVTCRANTPLTDVAHLMAENRISSVIVVDEAGRPVGLVTEKDLVHRVLTRPSWQAESLTAEMIMDDNLISVKVGDFYNQALLAMVRHQVKHLLVMEGETLAGILTLRDLLKTRSTGSLWVTDKIETARNLDELAIIGREVDSFLSALEVERATVPELFEIITELHDRLTCRVIDFCLQEMENKGYGPPPSEFCWINMGSAGRREQTLRTDQDNAIIHADEGGEGEKYFSILGPMVVEGLVRTGFARCRGGIMASNAQWRRSLGQWKKDIEIRANRADPGDTGTLSTFLDFRPVYGSFALARELWKYVLELFAKPVRAAHYLADEESRIRVPLTIWGGFATERSGPQKNGINMKQACRHIINCVRLFAVKNGISETSTLERIKCIKDKGIFSEEDAELISNAFEIMMMLRMRENRKKIRQGREADNYINPYQLRRFEQSLFKDALSAAAHLQKLARGRFVIY